MLKILLVDDEKYAIEGLISMLDWNRFQGELTGTALFGRGSRRAHGNTDSGCDHIRYKNGRYERHRAGTYRP